MTDARGTGRRGWIVGAVLLVVAAVAIAVVVVWPRLAGSHSASGGDGGGTSVTESSAPAAIPDPKVAVPTPRIRPMTPSDVAPTAPGVAGQLSKALANKAVAQLSGIVIDPLSGTALWQQNADAPRLPASSMKLLTGAAVLASADPNRRLTTKIVQGDQPGQIVFVGGGDVTLSARPAGAPTVLPGGPTVADLAAQVKAAGVHVTSIGLDTSYWTGPELADGWLADDIRGTPQDAHGYVTKMQALMVDADRIDPGNEDSPRTGDPAMTAGKALARALDKADLPITEARAPEGAKVIASVQSQPLSTLLAQALEQSDNVLSEALAREAAIAVGAAPSFAGVAAAITQALKDLGLSTAGLVVKDGSGMSDQDRVPPEILGRVMAMAVAGKPAIQRILLTGLPLAGVSGTLAPPRFSQPQNKAGAGWVRAKTGSLESTYALVGYVPDTGGRILVFAFNSNGVLNNETTGTRPALDALAAALRGCGCTG